MSQYVDKTSKGSEMRHMTIDEWRAEAMLRGGGNFIDVRFLCPRCENVSTPAQFVAVGAEGGRAPAECIGRTMTPMPKDDNAKPCNWAAFGFLRTLGRGIIVEFPDGKTVEAFPFAE